MSTIENKELHMSIEHFIADSEAFKKKYIEIETECRRGNFREYRYNSAFESVPILCQYVESGELGIRN